MVLENLILFELTILLMVDFTVSDTRVLDTTYIQVQLSILEKCNFRQTITVILLICKSNLGSILSRLSYNNNFFWRLLHKIHFNHYVVE